MAIVSFTKRNYSKEDIIEVLNSVRFYLPSSHKGLIDGLKSVFGILNGGKLTNKSLYTIIRDWKDLTCVGENKEIAFLYRCLVECYVLIVDAKIQKELKDNERKANKILYKAEARLNETIVSITNSVFIQLSHSVGVKIIRSNKTTFALELEVGVLNANGFTISDIEPYITNLGRLSIGNIFYAPQEKERKGFFSSLFHFIPDAVSYWAKQSAYQQNIKEWLSRFLEELSSDQKLIGRSVILYSFLNKYCSVVRRTQNKAIRKCKGWHTTTCRWVAFLLSIIAAVGLFVVAYLDEVLRQSEEAQKPRFPYLPPEISDVQQLSAIEDLWVYNALEKVVLVIGCIVLLEFVIAELRIFKLTFKVWRTFVSQKFISLNYLLNFHPSLVVKRFSFAVCLLGIIVWSTYKCCPQLFIQEKTLTRAEVLDSLSSKTPYEGALFYVNNRNNIEFLDSIYENTVMPAMESCDYLELKEVSRVLKKTKYNNTISTWMEAKRPKFLQEINAEIAHNEQVEISAVDNCIIPTLELELDSLIENNVDDILNSYSGGVFNYRKLAFLVGRDSSKFVSIFDENVDVMGFGKTVSEYARNYMYIISHQQNEYCKALTGNIFNYKAVFTQPKPMVNLSKNTIGFIQTYTDNEAKGVAVSAVKDFAVPIAIGFVSGGASLVYDVATMGYDIVQAIRNTEVSQEDMAKYLCEQDVVDQIRDIYTTSVRKQLINYIKTSNKLLYKKIEKEL